MSKPIAHVNVLDEVSAVVGGLRPADIDYFYERYGTKAPNFFFDPRYKVGAWDGNIRFFQKTGKTYAYLLEDIVSSLIQRGYEINLTDKRNPNIIHPEKIDEQFLSDNTHIGSDEPIVLYDYQVEAVNALTASGNGICIAGTGAGKAQPLTSKVLTPTGWKMMGDIKIGDSVLTPQGKTSTVLGVFPQGEKMIYEIIFHDGAKTHACAEHLWETAFPTKLHKASTHRRVVQTSDMMLFLEQKKQKVRHVPGNISIPLCKPVPIKENETLPIDPYVLGALLGDGGLTSNTPVISSVDEEILSRVNEWASNNSLTPKSIQNSRCDYRIIKIEPHNSVSPTPNVLTEKLKDLGILNPSSKEKFIPGMYKHSSIEQRWEIVRGLFDTDGTVDKRGNISFTTTSEQLAKDVQEVVWSLGGTCSITTRTPTYSYRNVKKSGSLAYTCFVHHAMPSLFFHLSHKRNRCASHHGANRIELMRRVVSITPIGIQPAQCILIDDPSHLYITDDYIVTHNTLICTALVKAYDSFNIRSLTIVPDTTLIKQTKAQYINSGLDTGEYSGDEKTLEHAHVVSTWQALKNNPAVIGTFEMVIVDECHGIKGNTLTNILTRHAHKLVYRFGFTGTLPKNDADKLSVQVAVGPVRFTKLAKDLIDRGILSNLQINIYQLEEDVMEQYKEACDEIVIGRPPTYAEFKEGYFPDYAAEREYLRRKQERIQWIANYIQVCADAQKGNVLCLVDSIPFGRRLMELIPNAIFVNGQDVKSAKHREEIYNLFKERNDLVVIATVHIAGTGLSINRIFNLVLVDVGKSFIRVIQAIGRGLRKAKDKNTVNIADICSDFKYSKRHLTQRIKMYKEANYPHKKIKVKDYHADI